MTAKTSSAPSSKKESSSIHADSHKKTVCLLVSHLSCFGGTGRVAAAMANRMVDEYDVHMVGVYRQSGDEPFFDLDERINQATMLDSERRLRTMAKDVFKPFKRYLKDNHIDIVFLIGNYQGFVALPVIATTGSTKFVFCDHGALMNQWDCKDVRLMRSWCARLCDATVALTERSRLDYIERFKLAPTKVHAIYNWLDPRLAEHRRPYDSEQKTILWAGRLDKEKGVDLLLEIARRVLPPRPDWEWHVYGTGELEDEFISKTHEYGLDGQLILKGYTANLYDLYPRYAIATLTSYREGLPMVLLEAKAVGLPLVSFNVSTGPDEIIRDGKDGYLIDCYDCDRFTRQLGVLMDDADLRVAMSKASQDNVGIFDKERIYAQWHALIEGLTA